MNTITAWLNTAGNKAIDATTTQTLLSQLSRTTDEKARLKLINRICEGNLKLVYTTVKKYSDKRYLRWGTDLSADLLQVGFLGLRHAVSRYDHTKGTRLSTIAVPWIRQKLGRHLVNNEQPIYVPESLVAELNYVKKHGTTSGSKRTPKNTRLLELARYAHAAHLSLDKPMEKGKAGTFVTLGDILETPDTSNTGEKIHQEMMEVRDLMAQAMIEPRVQDMILHYATKGGVLQQVAAKCGVNVKKARDIYNKSIARMQKLV